MSKQEIKEKIKSIENALDSGAGLSAEQVAALKSGLMDYRRKLAAFNDLTTEQEAQRVQNIANVDAAKVRLSGMIAMEGKQPTRQQKEVEEVATIQPITTGRIRTVTIPWPHKEKEVATEKNCRGGFKTAFGDLMENAAVKSGKLDQLDVSASLGTCLTYLRALETLTGALPDTKYFNFKTQSQRDVYAAVVDFYIQNAE